MEGDQLADLAPESATPTATATDTGGVVRLRVRTGTTS
jgi:hypothetical protein